MYCKKCGKNYKKGRKVCEDCGIALTPGVAPGVKKNGNKRMLIIGGIIAFAIIATFLIVGLTGLVQ